MGNHKFRLSDMIPNAWFYKLKEIGTKPISGKNRPARKKHSPPPFPSPVTPLFPAQKSSTFQPQSDSADHHSLSRPRKSYHFTRQPIAKHNKNPQSASHLSLVDPPRKSTGKRRPTTNSSRTKRPTSTTSSSTTTTTSTMTTTRYYSSSSVSAGWSCGATSTLHSHRPKPETSSNSNFNSNSTPLDSSPECLSLLPEYSPDQALPHCDDSSPIDPVGAWSSDPCECCRLDDRRDDTVIEVDEKSLGRKKSGDGFDGIGSMLPAIKTEHRKLNGPREVIDGKVNTRQSYGKYRERIGNGSNLSVKVVVKGGGGEESGASSPAVIRRLSSGSSGVRLRINSPRIARVTLGNSGRRCVSSSERSISSESLAIVKSSFDPQKDFRESMVEMIVENNIKTSKDLEELLACYLSLNADEYHDIIIKVFKQIWFDLNNSMRTGPVAN